MQHSTRVRPYEALITRERRPVFPADIESVNGQAGTVMIAEPWPKLIERLLNGRVFRLEDSASNEMSHAIGELEAWAVGRVLKSETVLEHGL